MTITPNDIGYAVADQGNDLATVLVSSQAVLYEDSPQERQEYYLGAALATLVSCLSYIGMANHYEMVGAAGSGEAVTLEIFDLIQDRVKQHFSNERN